MRRSGLFGRGAWALLVSAVVALLLLHQLYLSRAMPVAPYMDTLRVIALLDGWEHGRVALAQLWGVGSAHQGLINEVFIYANIKLLHYDALWASRLTGAVIASLCLLLGLTGLSWLRRDPGQAGAMWPWLGYLLFCVLVPIQLFSGAGFELLTLDLGLSLWIKNAAIVGYFVLHSAFLRAAATSASMWRRSLALMLLGPPLVLLVTMGWSFAFVGAATLQLLAAGNPARHGLRRYMPVLSLWTALAAYVGISLLGRSSGELAAAGVHFSELLPLAALALSGAVIPPGVAAGIGMPVLGQQMVGVLMMLVAAVFLVGLVRGRRPLPETTPLALLGYAGATALALAVGRGGEGAGAMLASRYYMDLVLFPIGLGWLALMLGRATAMRLLVMSALCLMLLFQCLTYRQEWRAAPYRAAIFSAMNQALLQQVPDKHAADTLQAPLGDARMASRIMKMEGLGPFHGAPAGSCDQESLVRGQGWYGDENGGAWMAADALLAVPGCPCTLSMTVFLPTGFPARTLTITAPDGRHDVVPMVPGGAADVQVALPVRQGSLAFRSDRTSQPVLLGQSADARELGVYVGPLSIQCPLPEGR